MATGQRWSHLRFESRIHRSSYLPPLGGGRCCWMARPLERSHRPKCPTNSLTCTTRAAGCGAMRMRFDVWRFPFGRVATENVRQGVAVTRQTGQVLTPTAAPDGDQIAFVSDSGGHTNSLGDFHAEWRPSADYIRGQSCGVGWCASVVAYVEARSRSSRQRVSPAWSSASGPSTLTAAIFGTSSHQASACPGRRTANRSTTQTCPSAR